MAEPRQPPPQTRRVELVRRVGSKPVVGYQPTVDTGRVERRRLHVCARHDGILRQCGMGFFLSFVATTQLFTLAVCPVALCWRLLR
jgi:hypothetical protein